MVVLSFHKTGFNIYFKGKNIGDGYYEGNLIMNKQNT